MRDKNGSPPGRLGMWPGRPKKKRGFSPSRSVGRRLRLQPTLGGRHTASRAQLQREYGESARGPPLPTPHDRTLDRRDPRTLRGIRTPDASIRLGRLSACHRLPYPCDERIPRAFPTPFHRLSPSLASAGASPSRSKSTATPRVSRRVRPRPSNGLVAGDSRRTVSSRTNSPAP